MPIPCFGLLGNHSVVLMDEAVKKIIRKIALQGRFLLSTALILCSGFSSSALAQAWESLPDMERKRFESSAVQYNENIYVFNGFGAFLHVEPTIEKFNAATSNWSIVGNSSLVAGTAVTHNGIVRSGDDVWIIGGREGQHPGRVTNAVSIFNLSTNSWRDGPNMPRPVAAGGTALVNNRIHWFGGLDANARCDVSNHYVYDLSAPSAGWQEITHQAAMPTPRNHFATVVLNGLIYAIGGQFGHDNCPGKNTQDSELVHVFNPATNQWSRIANLPTVQSHMEPSSFAYAGAIYVIGGETSGNKIFRYEPQADDWDVVGTLPGILVAPVARVVDNKLIVASGGSPNFQSPSNKTYATDMAQFLLPGASLQNDFSSTQITNNVVVQSEPAAGESMITLEAEYHDFNTPSVTHSWVTTNLPGSSNNSAVITNPNVGDLKTSSTGSPELRYFAYFDKPGNWYVWLRGWGDTNAQGEGKNDSIHAGLNGNISSTADQIDNFPSGWNWSNSTRDFLRATLTIPDSGVHAFNLWMREDGLAVDKIILTTDPN